jgi:ubiquinone/menaquinone biosynthesis C-methylase UbiE
VGSSSDYVFGDTDVAARRLDLVAETWASSSTTFLRDDVPKRPRLALDLGCGPGHTTRLLAATTGATRTVGLDSSESFIAHARADAPDGVVFVEHNLMDLPFPTGRVNLAYARFVLSHIPRPDRVVRAWMSQLELGGMLALDEVEWIRTDDPTLRRYLTMLSELLKARGSSLAVGPTVDKFDGGRDGRKRTSVVRVHPVPVALAAELFAVNFTTWREDPFVRDGHSRDDLDDLASALGELVKGPREPRITWGMRQATFERTG